MFPEAPFGRRQRLRGRQRAPTSCSRQPLQEERPPVLLGASLNAPSSAANPVIVAVFLMTTLLKMMLMNHTGRAGGLIQAKLEMLKD